MFALRALLLIVSAAACTALVIGQDVGVLEARGIKCAEGAPANVSTITLDNGAVVDTWACKTSAAEIKAAKEEEAFALEKLDARGVSISETTLTKRGYNACGIYCPTYCYGGAGGGPDPNHCTQLAQGWTSGTFVVNQGVTVYYSLASCQVLVRNLGNFGGLTYCWNDLRGVTNYIAWNCQATQNAHGGYCPMNNEWSIGSIGVSACCD
ncbi:hypothetical protein BKA62DRAFT_757098 [Auriculariales sp. MPI-PUGE-AT-0066]|nr:hypothetical protein BKA62DRAFT_757098 [Auriculariales sp. MPI-PUGE-AT-0066]